ncbi:MAG: type II toxin-antitoxin system VapC family toxin [Streptococcaceae bacterium]|jgi:PIN domain nuclease of toxin-antitoxin system|nr:type II toxin-antitoxin system VapC family toxin [Streptococcaceae bacterium]
MRQLLIDTHILIWIFYAPEKISTKIKKLLEDEESIVYYSTISLQELSMLYAKKKFDFRGKSPEDLRLLAIQSNFEELVITGNLTTSYYQLPEKDNHKDPFDRLLIWEAIQRKLTLISSDSKYEQYKVDGLKLLKN